MKKLIRCKVCGYVMEEGSLKDVCPACGVPKTAFEAYTSRVSEKRENILSLHIHPILVHLPVGFTIFFLIILISGYIFSSSIASQLFSTANLIGIIMPIFVFLGGASGFLDGKARFKKLKSPFIKIKIVFGVVFFILSCSLTTLILIGLINYIVMLIFSILFIVCSTILGKIGSNLIEAKMPG